MLEILSDVWLESDPRVCWRKLLIDANDLILKYCQGISDGKVRYNMECRFDILFVYFPWITRAR